MSSDRCTRLLLIRHGAVADDWHGRIYGNLDVPLSARGEAQSRAAAEACADRRLTAVVSSGLARAEAIAAHLRAPRGLERQDDPRLEEMYRGRWAGAPTAVIAEGWPAAWQRFRRSRGLLTPPGGEPITRVRARVREALDELAAAVGDSYGAPGSPAGAAVAHRWVIATVACAARGWALDRAAEVELDYGARLEVDWPLDGRGRPREVLLAPCPDPSPPGRGAPARH